MWRWTALLVIISLLIISQHAVTTKVEAQNKSFYMYDLPEEFWWRWPVDGAQCGTGYVSHDHKQNSGVGKLLNPDDGLFLTFHWGLFSSLYNRFKRSRLRTLDPEQASMFIIPYDLALDGFVDPDTCTKRLKVSSGILQKLNETVISQKYFQRHNGADHVLLWSLGQHHPWPGYGGVKFMRITCRKCTVTCYWMDASKFEGRFVSVPFSSSYHWWEGIKTLPWDLSRTAQRNLTAVYLGSTQTLTPKHTNLRKSIAQQCAADPDCHWFQLDHTARDSNIAGFLSTYTRAVFCLCPPGDDPTRKAVVDIIVSGCIPVFFLVQTLFNQHPWHLTEEEVLDISVFIPEWMARIHKTNVMTVLKSIPPEVIRLKQEALAAIAPRIQYSMPPPERLADKYENSTWDPPFVDSVQLTLEGLFARVDDVLHSRSTHIPRKQEPVWVWNDQYKDVRIQVPNITAARRAVRLEQDALIRQGMLINRHGP